VPEVLFIVDVGREVAAVREANLLKVPMVAMVDTNCNPQDIDYVIPSNDDAIRAIKLLVARMADAVLEGKAMRKEDETAEEETPVASEKRADARPSKSRKGQRVVEAANVDEVGEVDLLGESTLAKLNVARKPADVVAAVEETVVVAAADETEPVSEEKAEETAAQPEVKDEAGADTSAPVA
jgi:small subunit ribosomal protein S2